MSLALNGGFVMPTTENDTEKEVPCFWDNHRRVGLDCWLSSIPLEFNILFENESHALSIQIDMTLCFIFRFGPPRKCISERQGKPPTLDVLRSPSVGPCVELSQIHCPASPKQRTKLTITSMWIAVLKDDFMIWNIHYHRKCEKQL